MQKSACILQGKLKLTLNSRTLEGKDSPTQYEGDKYNVLESGEMKQNVA